MSQLQLFDIVDKDKLTCDIFQAYFDARKNKRNTFNALAFEKYFESNLFDLCDNIISYDYKPKQSICFIVDRPVKREIFAADFRDRVVHHLIYNYIAPVFEKTFINDAYSCRVGKGTHYGIKRIDHFIRSCSQNYQHDCYMLKLDIKGYFMSMNKTLLFEKVKSEILRTRHKHDFDIPLVLYLIEKTIFNDPTKNCIVKGHRGDWAGLPSSKSLFHAAPNCGLPIGNLTSQLFGNVYLNEFDHWIKKEFNIKYYGRYVDDFVIVHPDKAFLSGLIPQIAEFLQTKLHLTLHPNKIYLQHHSKGVQYLGAIIKPWRIYISNRTKGNFYQAIQQQNQIIRKHTPCPITGINPPQEEKDQFLCTMNSYLGILNPDSKNTNGNGLYKTYRLRRKMVNGYLSGWWCNLVEVRGYGKLG